MAELSRTLTSAATGLPRSVFAGAFPAPFREQSLRERSGTSGTTDDGLRLRDGLFARLHDQTPIFLQNHELLTGPNPLFRSPSGGSHDSSLRIDFAGAL